MSDPVLFRAPVDGIRLVADLRPEGWSLWFNWKRYGDAWGGDEQATYGPLSFSELQDVLNAVLDELPQGWQDS